MARKRPIMELIGDKKLVRKLERLEKKAARRMEKKVLRAGAAVYKKAIKKEVPVDEGHLKKSIDFKLTGKGGAVIGPSADYKEDGEMPSNYSHLVEYGFVKGRRRMTPDASGAVRT